MLTQLETQVLDQAVTLNGCGAKTIADFKNDNFSWFNIHDLQELTGLNIFTLSGVLGSLVHKNVLGKEKRTKKEGGDLFYITQSYIEEVCK